MKKYTFFEILTALFAGLIILMIIGSVECNIGRAYVLMISLVAVLYVGGWFDKKGGYGEKE